MLALPMSSNFETKRAVSRGTTNTMKSYYTTQMQEFATQSSRLRNKAYSFNHTVSVQEIRGNIESNVYSLRQRIV